jgi:hypothetical protein
MDIILGDQICIIQCVCIYIKKNYKKKRKKKKEKKADYSYI